MIQDGTLYWITGLSGAGKTTIGSKLYGELKKEKSNVLLLDGDMMKVIVNDTVGYSDEARRNRAMKYAKLCKMLTDQGMIVVCCTISMYDEIRDYNRANNKEYVEVFLDVPIEVLRRRDQKGLYSSYRRGESTDIAGEDLAVEFPKNPDVVIVNDGSVTVEDCVARILQR